MTLNIAKQTPWGSAEEGEQIAPGITFYSTAGHGGYHLSRERRRQMPECLRRDDQWYEEDCEWARVACAFPEAFSEKVVAVARDTLREWFPGAYEAFSGETIPPGESFKKDQRAFLRAHAEDYVVRVAWGDWHWQVPKGCVVVSATKGRQRPTTDCSERYFRLPLTEYQGRSRLGFVIDLDCHVEVAPLQAMS